MKLIEIDLPSYNEEKEKRIDIFLDYGKKLKELLENRIDIVGFDPGFLISHVAALSYYGKDNKLHLRLERGYTETLSFKLVHMILKSHNLHNSDIERIVEVKE